MSNATHPPRRMRFSLSSRPNCRRICACRRHTGWGPRLVAAATGLKQSTIVWTVLHLPGSPGDCGRPGRRQTATSGGRARTKVERFHQTMAREWAYRSHRDIAKLGRPLQHAATTQLSETGPPGVS